MKRFFCVFIFGILVSLFQAYSFERVISPVPGKFANKQSLVIDLNDGAECFYSYTNSDPLSFGFAYDGPVLIDADGNVDLFVVAVKDGQYENYEIRYAVNEQNDFPDMSPEKNFIDSISSQQIMILNGEKQLQIPDTFHYSIGNERSPYLVGTSLNVSPDNRLSRYIPCTVSDGRNFWRFILFLTGGEAGTFAKFSVPFEIEDWDTFRFTGKKLIWSIDGSDWSSSMEPVFLDRSVEHTVHWQSVAYEKGNPVQSFVLAPKPELIVENADKISRFKIRGDLRYRMEIISSGAGGEINEKSGVFTHLAFDTVEGDSIYSKALFAFYCDGVYQGNLSADYFIDKKPPMPPEFSASEEGMFARSDVDLRILAEENSDIFYALSGPVSVENGVYTSELEKVAVGPFVEYDGKGIFLPSDSASAVYYKVLAFAKDKFGNASAVAEYKVIIDEYNYFVDSRSNSADADGSREKPFSAFAQLVDVINRGKFSHFYVSGTLMIPSEEIEVLSNCSFTGINSAKLIFSENSSIILRSASLEFSDFIIEKKESDEKSMDSKLFILENSVVSFSGCELYLHSENSATAFTVSNSVVSMLDSGLTVDGKDYACGISGFDSKFSIKNCHTSVIAETCVNFSLSGGSFEMLATDCNVIAALGRVIEASGVNLKLKGNSYTGEFEKKRRGINAVWKDEASLVIEDSGNVSSGF